ncbi:RES family NAD+ phosphorylase [Halomonas sp. 25-S5]|uniref:RES family NAD+ phosphorylase n=1 Tax=Halomonas sp. 25-S5 TaxID=2994065 RepID=UPI0024687922|nr:RES family NAD+ phosphorylase [Halomonas sp. 25-S5]
MLYQIQAITNPRLKAEVGEIGLIPTTEIPFGIPGCSYATAPFTHLAQEGSRFSHGRYGVLYIADKIETALAEVRHHQEAYWRNLPDLSYDRFVFRGLLCHFNEDGLIDCLTVPKEDPIYAPDDYHASRELGEAAKAANAPGLRYHSVRHPGAVCWGLMTPRPVTSIVQTAHYEMVWNGSISGISRLSYP